MSSTPNLPAPQNGVPLDARALVRGQTAVLPAKVGPGPGTTNFTPSRFLGALRARWFLAFSLALLALGVANVAAWFLLQPKATVRATLFVASTPPKIAMSTLENTASPSELTTFQKTQASLVKSRLVLSKALSDPEIRDRDLVKQHADPVEWLDMELNSDTTIGPEFISVWMRGDQTKDLEAIINKVIDAYIHEIIEKEHKKRSDRLEQLRLISTDFDEKLRLKRRQLRVLEDDYGTGTKTMELNQQFALEELSNAKKLLFEHRATRRTAEAECNALENAPQISVKSPDPASVSDEDLRTKDLFLAQLLAEHARLQQRLEADIPTYTLGEKDKDIKRLKAELDNVKKSIESRKKEWLAAEAKKQEAQARAERQVTIMHLKQKIKGTKSLEDDDQKEVDRLTEKAKKTNRSSSDMVTFKDEIAQIEVTRAKITSELEALKIELQAPPRVWSLETAASSWGKAEQRRYLGMAMASVLALGLALGGVGWMELRARRITAVDDVASGLGMSVLGCIPALPNGNGNKHTRTLNLLSENSAKTILEESVDMTRTMLLYAARTKGMRVVMVTSAVGGEGKSSVASHIATSLAHSGHRTLLIDFDTRRPMLHKVFSIRPVPGISNLLVEDNLSLHETIQPTTLPNLFLLPAGNRPGQILQTLAQDRIKGILEELRKCYDFILVDSCPVLPVTDSLVIAQHVEAVVVSVLRHVSRVPNVLTAWQRLEKLGVPILGTVVSGVEQEEGYTYPYGYNALQETPTTAQATEETLSKRGVSP
jgi:capsular exopolysaccharide synthesis family protein